MAYGNLNTTKTWEEITREVREELRKWGITGYILPCKGDSVRLKPVTVRMKIQGEERQLTCDRFHDRNRPERDYAAIAIALRSARLADQRGIGAVFAQAAQLAALPGPNDPHHVLGVKPGASQVEITAAYRKKVMEAHPGHGGNREALEKVMKAGRLLRS